MKRNLEYWMQFAAVTAITAAVTATFINIAAAFAADESKVQANLYVNTPSIHDSVMNELTRGEQEDAATGRNMRQRTIQENSAAQGQLPTSMLWPAYKYLPHLSFSFAA